MGWRVLDEAAREGGEGGGEGVGGVVVDGGGVGGWECVREISHAGVLEASGVVAGWWIMYPVVVRSAGIFGGVDDDVCGGFVGFEEGGFFYSSIAMCFFSKCAMERLFFSMNIMWPFPRIP